MSAITTVGFKVDIAFPPTDSLDVGVTPIPTFPKSWSITKLSDVLPANVKAPLVPIL